MRRYLLFLAFVISLVGGCADTDSSEQRPRKRTRFEFKETIVRDGDTGLIRLGPFRRSNVADILCQRWTVATDMENSNLPEKGFALFKDSSVLFDPLGKIRQGKWRIENEMGERFIVFDFEEDDKRCRLDRLASLEMMLTVPPSPGIQLTFVAAGEVHANMLNDPFHPVNNRWRIRPERPETDLAIYRRLKNCLLFFALYYRDHIKRQKETISFEGLPAVFEWYNKGIGLPDVDEISDSWIECFYDRDEALKGYALLRKLIVDYEYVWPVGAPSWTYETHSVLEQMYHRIDKLKPQ